MRVVMRNLRARTSGSAPTERAPAKIQTSSARVCDVVRRLRALH